MKVSTMFLVSNALAGSNLFCQNNGKYDCRYPCGGSTIDGNFECSKIDPSWTCESTYSGACNFDTTCEAHGLKCNATGLSASMECPKESSAAPWDGGCGCGCDSIACQSFPFGPPPIDPSHPFTNGTLKAAILSKCISKSPTPPPAPAVECTGKSSNLEKNDCAAWGEWFDASNGKNWLKCSDSRQDPCSCQVYITCLNGHITGIDMQNIPGVAGTIPPSLAKLPLTQLVLSGNQLTGTVPDFAFDKIDYCTFYPLRPPKKHKTDLANSILYS